MNQNHADNITLPCLAEQLLPHRSPMLLIDSLLQREKDKAVATAKLAQDNIFLSGDRGLLTEYFIELVAQTMAAANGYDALLDHSAVKDGFIVGIEAFSLHREPREIDEFRIVAVKVMEFAQMQVIDGVVFADTTCIASVRLKLWENKSKSTGE